MNKKVNKKTKITVGIFLSLLLLFFGYSYLLKKQQFAMSEKRKAEQEVYQKNLNEKSRKKKELEIELEKLKSKFKAKETEVQFYIDQSKYLGAQSQDSNLYYSEKLEIWGQAEEYKRKASEAINELSNINSEIKSLEEKINAL